MQEKILIINDDADVRAIIRVILENDGYLTSEAADGRRGLDLASQEHPDIILLDIMMPGLDGYKTCQLLKENPKTKNIPVIFLSNLTNSKDKVRGLEVGAVDFINNAVDLGELLARVKTHLEIKSLNQALANSNVELMRKQKALDESLNAAAVIQRSFLLSSTQKIPEIELASLWIPANKIGGDIFNVIHYGGDSVNFYMIDVSGHDIPSALVTISVSQFLLQYNLSANSSPSILETLKVLNQAYPFERFNRYYTIFYLTLNRRTGQFSYSSAGHPPAIVVKKNNECKFLTQGGVILGLMDSPHYDVGSDVLEPGDKIFLYTDGLYERKNKKGDLFGLDNLISLIKSCKDDPVEKMISNIHRSIEDFGDNIPAEDDTSIMGFEYQKSFCDLQ